MRVRVIVRVCVSLSLCGLCVWRSSKEASCVQRPSGLKQEVSVKQSSSRHRASGVLRCTRGDKTRTGRTQCTRGVSGVCSGCAQGGGRPGACSVRGKGVRAAGVRGAPQRRMLSAEASGFREYKPGVQRRRGGCLQPPPRRCLHSLARLCGSRCALRAVWLCGCVRLCQARSEGQAEGREAGGREAGGGRQKGGQGGRVTQKGEAPKTTACVSSR